MSDVWNEFPMEPVEPAKEYRRVRVSEKGVIIKADGTVEPAGVCGYLEERDKLAAEALRPWLEQIVRPVRCLKCGNVQNVTDDADTCVILRCFNMASQELAICDDCNRRHTLTDLLPFIHKAIEQAAADEIDLVARDTIDSHNNCPDPNCPTCKYNEPMIRAMEKALIEKGERGREHDKFASEALARWFEQIEAKLKDMDYPNYQPTEAEIADIFKLKTTHEPRPEAAND